MERFAGLLGTHKDRPPEATVGAIRDILDATGLHPIEQNWRVFSEHCVSLRLIDPLYPSAGANGKGVDRYYALASAYAEFMERLQNGALYGDSYGLMPEGGYFRPDAREMATEDTLETIRKVCRPTMDTSEATVFALLGERTACVPYRDVRTRSMVYLPWDALRFALGTNGMCAGNTPEEALLHGLCEICERFAVRESYRTARPLPTIPLAALSRYPIHAAVEQIQDAGYSILLKDCSMGGLVPVVALVLLNRDGTGYRAAFGSDPVLEVAVQRCMTEVVQGIAGDELEALLNPLDLTADLTPSEDNPFTRGTELRDFEMLRFMISGSCHAPSTLFLDPGLAASPHAFQRTFVSHAHSLRWLVKRILAQGSTILTRDVSFLGFPSYQLYVPGMSEVLFVDEVLARSAGEHLRRVRRCLLDLPGADPIELRDCVPLLHSIVAHPFFSARLSRTDTRDWMTHLTGVSLREDSDFRGFAEFLLAAMHNRAGDYGMAATELGKLLARKTALAGLENPAYALCYLQYFRLRAANADERFIRRSLSSIFGQAIARVVIGDLRKPEHSFRRLALPRCGRCSGCPVRAACRYPRWREVGQAFARVARVPPTDETGIPALAV